MKAKAVLLLIPAVALLAGCSTPHSRVSDLRLGMTPDEVLDTMGKPFTVRAAKLYENEEWQEVWEYVPPVFSVAGFADRYDKEYWLYFENGKLVQYGEPFDFSGETTVNFRDGDSQSTIIDYVPEKSTK